MASLPPDDRPSKKARVCLIEPDEQPDDIIETIASYLKALLLVPDGVPKLPGSLRSLSKTKLSLEATQNVFDEHGFRTNVVLSPRPALSIYKDSCVLETDDAAAPQQGKSFLVSMLGMHPLQSELELLYSTSIGALYSLKLFVLKIKNNCPKASQNQLVSSVIEEHLTMIRSLASGSTMSALHSASSRVSRKVTTLIGLIVKSDPRLRTDQLEKEFERLQLWNSTFSNSLMQLFLDQNDSCIKQIYFKSSPMASKYERITIFLYDPEFDLVKPPPFTFLPCLRTALDDGPHVVVEDMLQSFWSHLLRHGYFATESMQEEMTPHLIEYFLSGLSSDPSIPLNLSAHFDPNYPLSFYLQGKAGTGKSSLVRNFVPALNETIQQYVDPEMLVRFVKQTLNKPRDDLELELELRPNNNDLSVMSIIQGRRMTMAQSKPGLVVVDLEEMPSNDLAANPNQLDTCQLISQRFSGRNGDYKEGSAPRNSSKRGISGDTNLVMLFTSNYELEQECCAALMKLSMFSHLKQIKTTAVSGDERETFAVTYTKQCIQDLLIGARPSVALDLRIPFGDGDIRPLVRHIRMLAFYVCALVEPNSSAISANIVQTGGFCTVSVGTKHIELKLGSLENLFPKSPQVFDERAGETVKRIVLRNEANKEKDFTELSQILDFYFAKTLAPAVVVSQNAELISQLVQAVGACDDVHHIPGINPSTYKMMKSLYDPTGTPNLRDDILKMCRRRGALCAVELICTDANAQLCIREMIEDSPSMTAFSTNKSALYKEGLFFGVYIQGEITPEVRSRASLIL